RNWQARLTDRGRTTESPYHYPSISIQPAYIKRVLGHCDRPTIVRPRVIEPPFVVLPVRECRPHYLQNLGGALVAADATYFQTKLVVEQIDGRVVGEPLETGELERLHGALAIFKKFWVKTELLHLRVLLEACDTGV